ncbi:nucleotidyltransferase family protein [Leifsonia shinshuensis]
MPTTPSETIAVLREDINRTLRAFDVEAAGVFGSTARGEDTTASDIDLVVKFRSGAIRDVVLLTDALEQLTGRHVDVVDYDRVRARAQATGIGQSILAETVPL